MAVASRRVSEETRLGGMLGEKGEATRMVALLRKKKNFLIPLRRLNHCDYDNLRNICRKK